MWGGGFTIVQSRGRAQAWVSKVRAFVCLCVRVCVRTHAAGLFVHPRKIDNWREASLAGSCTCAAAAVRRRREVARVCRNVGSKIWDSWTLDCFVCLFFLFSLFFLIKA